MNPILHEFRIYFGNTIVDRREAREHQTALKLQAERALIVELIAERARRDKASITRFTFVEYKATHDRRKDAYRDPKPVARFNYLGEEIAL